MVKIVKKDGTFQNYDVTKVARAIRKASCRSLTPLSEDQILILCEKIEEELVNCGREAVTVDAVHNLVEDTLETMSPDISKLYKDFRNYKVNFVERMDRDYYARRDVVLNGCKENSNMKDTAVSSQRILKYNISNKSDYEAFFLTLPELQATRDGFIYPHDESARLDGINCCLFDIQSVLDGGFSMGDIQYTEIKSLPAAFSVIADVIGNTTSEQYGGFTVSHIDEVLEKYAQKSYEKYFERGVTMAKRTTADICKKLGWIMDEFSEVAKLKKSWETQADEYAMALLQHDFEQGFQGWELRFNTVGSSRGDYPFITLTFGLGTSKFAKMASMALLKVRKNGQGPTGKKHPVPFPKLVLLYDKNLHGKGKELYDLYRENLKCTAKTMYPDNLSLTGEGYVASIYKKYGKAISPMGCRAFLAPWFERGGVSPADDSDMPVFIGRFNVGAISLNLPMILEKSRKENKDFFELLDHYLEMIRGLHKRTYDYLGEKRASSNSIMFCEGGAYKGHLHPDEKIKPLLASATASFGITALNELQQLHNGKSIYEDGAFCLEVMQYINDRVAEFKKEDGHLYAIYGTPAEGLCGKQVQQFRRMYGIIPGVSDKEYFSNSFHCHVAEDITPIQKQDSEVRFWDFFNGGKIHHDRYNVQYNLEAHEAINDRAMELGFYEGANFSLRYCNDCGHEWLNANACPNCNSENVTGLDKMNGYISYSLINGGTRLNSAKLAEIEDRNCM